MEAEVLAQDSRASDAQFSAMGMTAKLGALNWSLQLSSRLRDLQVAEDEAAVASQMLADAEARVRGLRVLVERTRAEIDTLERIGVVVRVGRARLREREEEEGEEEREEEKELDERLETDVDTDVD